MSNGIKHRSTPKAEVTIDNALVQSLISEQFPLLKNLSIDFLDAGWDNEMYKIGSEYIARLPRRKAALPLLENERNFLPELSTRLPLKIPNPIFLGTPNKFYPWNWNLIPWFDGEPAYLHTLDQDQATLLAQFLMSLHTDPPAGIGTNSARLTLLEKQKGTEIRMQALAKKTPVITDRIRSIWNDGINSDHNFIPKLIHADLHPKNILVKDQQLQAIIDWGDMTSGDVSIDLASFFTVLKNPEDIQTALELYNPTEAQLLKAKAWAVFMGVIMLDTGLVDNPVHADIGSQILTSLNEL